jgi:hypothetical protein
MASENGAWIFQANPREWDVGRFLADVRRGATSAKTTWLTPNAVARDRGRGSGLLWMSGSENNAGVVAVAAVVSPAAEIPEDKPEYRMPGYQDKYGPPRTRLVIRIEAPLKFT